MANLMLSLDDDVLQKAREIALGERTSGNAVVREFLTGYAGDRSRRLKALDAPGCACGSRSLGQCGGLGA